MNSRTAAFGIGTALVGLLIGLAVGTPKIVGSPLYPGAVGRYHSTAGATDNLFVTDTTTGQTWLWEGKWRTLPKPE